MVRELHAARYFLLRVIGIRNWLKMVVYGIWIILKLNILNAFSRVVMVINRKNVPIFKVFYKLNFYLKSQNKTYIV